ncbi:MAG: outer membrane lipoprotein chaperone LolA [Gammaproteobacteria bacterium]|nr:MAG: outer membrane lipoprotein chaperone LolA [Gammaproteobacteria bacterium]
MIRQCYQMLAGLLLATVLAISPVLAATPEQSLERFFNKVSTYQASFKQVVLDDSGQAVQQASGRLWIQRPGLFRWDYESPYAQQIVADGKKLWVYDIGLQQVTVRASEEALQGTPAMLLSGKGGVLKRFKIEPQPSHKGLDWLALLPRTGDSGYRRIRLGFRQGRLDTMELIDNFDQLTRITLLDVAENRRIRKSVFHFTPPDNVDIVGDVR